MEPLDNNKRVPFWFRIERGASLEALTLCERHFGVSLPGELRELLMQQDGGVSNYTGFEKGEEYFPVLPFLSVDLSASGHTYFTADRIRDESGVPEGVVIFAAGGEDWLGLDYRRSRDCPGVVYSSDAGEVVETVAVDFSEFLNHLIE